MSILAIVHPSGLLAKELQGALDQDRGPWEAIRLLSTDEKEVGTLTEVRRAAAMVQRYEEGSLDAVDLVFFCGALERNRAALAKVGAGATAVLLSFDAAAGDGRPLVAGVNLDSTVRGQTLLSPHPGAILLAHLLHPLRGFGLEQAVATLVQPASMFDTAGLDELFDQTRRIVAITEKQPPTVFPRQLAFNLFRGAEPADHLAGLVRAVLGAELPVAVQVLQGSVFHCFSASLFVRFAEDPGEPAVRDALAAHPTIELSADGGLIGPIDAPASNRLLVGSVHRDPVQPAGYWLWAVMDNLTVGGADNAVAIAHAALG